MQCNTVSSRHFDPGFLQHKSVLPFYAGPKKINKKLHISRLFTYHDIPDIPPDSPNFEQSYKASP